MSGLALDLLIARAAARLAPEPAAPCAPATGDHDIDASLAEVLPAVSFRPAAVLVGIVARAEPTVLLTTRAARLAAHAGQVAFPGGRVDATDPSPLATALREAEEEIGLLPQAVRPLGYLDRYRTGTGYEIVPVVGLIAAEAAWAPNPAEVEDVFEVPLAFLMDRANHREGEVEWQGRLRRFIAMPYQNRYIWGATAGILHNFHRRLFE